MPGIYPDYPEGGTFCDIFYALSREQAIIKCQRQMAVNMCQSDHLREIDREDWREVFESRAEIDVVDVLDMFQIFGVFQ